MNKNLFFAATAAVALSSCSNNEITEALEQSDNVNSIRMSLATGVTRGIETTTGTVETSNTINLLYAGTASDKHGESNKGEAVSGSLEMIYDKTNDVWNQSATDKFLWSQLALPASFYSMHTGSKALTVTENKLDTINATFEEYTPNKDIAKQEDLVYYAGSIGSMPAGGYIRGNFSHALSRIEIKSNQGEYQPYVLTVDLMNVKESGTATLQAEGKSCAWNSSSAEKIAYNYLDQTKEQAPIATTNGKLITSISDKSPADNNMIIIPQALTSAADIIGLDGAGDPVVNGGDVTADVVINGKGKVGESGRIEPAAFTKIGGSYIKVLYRMQKGDIQYPGYERADSCEAYISMRDAHKADPNKNPAVLPEGTGDASQLFVLVGFPFGKDQAFEVGKDYDVNLGLGTNGGYLLYDYYFDVNGDPTNIKIAGLKPGDPVIDADAAIGIMVSVSDWESAGNVDTATDKDTVTE